MEKVLKDESLKQYRGKFPTKPKEKITKDYSCHTVLRKDTTAVDTVVGIDEGVDLPDELPADVTPVEKVTPAE